MLTLNATQLSGVRYLLANREAVQVLYQLVRSTTPAIHTLISDLTVPSGFAIKKERLNRGVDVKLDVPFELWDKPPAEVTALFKETNLLKGAWMKNLQINQNILQNHTSRMSYNLCTTHWRHS
ncbi:unnamed protein product [Schistosoma haematobium]|nr:unnamed protein product [Schistosoma haematobium]